jgi:hypothetical protein
MLRAEVCGVMRGVISVLDAAVFRIPAVHAL